MKVAPALIGKAGEMLVAAELLRRGVEVAHPASDVGVDLLAYRLSAGNATPSSVVPVQVKSYSRTGFRFLTSWFNKAPGLVLVSVWHLLETPQCFVFGSLQDVENALGPQHVATASWMANGIYSATTPTKEALERMQPHLNRWDRIIDRIT